MVGRTGDASKLCHLSSEVLHYYIRLTAFFQYNLGKPAAAR